MAREESSEKKIMRSAYLWNTTGSMINAFQSVFMLVVITRVCDLETAGIFTLAFASANLFLNLGKFGMRQFEASDVAPHYGFKAYLLSRVITSVAMIACGFIHLGWSAFNLGYPAHKFLAIALMILLKVVDSFEDVFNGSYQQAGRLDVSGRQMTLRMVSMIASFVVALVLTHNLVVATATALVASLAVLLGAIVFIRQRLDMPIWHREAPGQTPLPLLRECIPLFLATFLLFYVGNAPKYAIDAVMDDVAQARYGFIAMPVFVVNLLAQFVYMPLVEPLSKRWANGDVAGFVHAFLRQIGIVGLVTIICVSGAAVLGPPVLGILYNTDLTGFRLELCILVLGGGFLALATLFTSGITIMREQRRLVPGYVAVATLAALASVPLVRLWGIRGASLCYIVSMTVLATWFGLVFFTHARRGKRTSA